jgi:beta-lactamase class D
VFWLPAPGRQTIRISPDEQAQLLRRLRRGQMPFAPEKVEVLKQIMHIETTGKGSLYGKTGTGSDGSTIAWFIGWVETGDGGKTRTAGRTIRTFACIARKPGLTGIDVRGMVRAILEQEGLL